MSWTRSFLKDERILSTSLARRISGNFMNENGVELKTLFLDKGDDDSEKGSLKI